MTELGELPHEWVESQIKDRCEILTGGTPNTKNRDYWEPQEIPWMKSGEIQGHTIKSVSTFISKKGLENSNARWLPKQSVVIALAGRGKTRGTTAILEFDCTCNQSVICMIPDNEVSYKYVHYYLTNQYDYIRRLTGDKDRSGLNKQLVGNIPLYYPPLPEQKKIAAVLSAVQEAKEKTGAVINAAKELKKSMMKHLFTYGAVPLEDAEKVPLKETEIGMIPEGWAVRKFGDVISIKQGQVSPLEEPFSDMLHIGPENIESNTGRILSPKIASELGLISGKYLFTENDVLYSKIRPYLRKVALPQFTGICSADMYPLQPIDNNLLRTFVYGYLLTETFTREATSHQNRTGIPKINRTQLKSIPFPIPPIVEQKAISQLLFSIENKIETEIYKQTALDSLFKSLLHNLMTGKVRVDNLNV